MTLMGSYIDIDDLLGYEITDNDNKYFKNIYKCLGISML